MKKIFLKAYDKVNFGDDLFIHSILSRYPNTKFYLISDNAYKKNLKNYSNLKVIDKNSILLKFLKRIRESFLVRYLYYIEGKCDASVYIGGSIFIEYPTWKNIVDSWKYLTDKYSYYILGANFGPYKDENYRKEMDTVYSCMKDVCFRDQYSKELFKNNDYVRYAPDILFSQSIPLCSVEKGKIFVSLIDCINKDEGVHDFFNYGEDYLNKLIEIIKEYINRSYKIVLCSFCELEGDTKSVEFIRNNLSSTDKVSTLIYNGKNKDEILNEISSSEYIIGSRFHAIILGMVASKPVFPIVYSNKTLNMLIDIQYKGNYIDLKNIKDIDFDYVNSNLINNYIVNIEQYRLDSLNHYQKLDELLR